MPLKELIETEMRCAGATPDYAGYFYLMYAVNASITDGSPLEQAAMRIYTQVAEQCGVSPSSVERGIRMLGPVMWRNGENTLLKSAFPGSMELIAALRDNVLAHMRECGAANA